MLPDDFQFRPPPTDTEKLHALISYLKTLHLTGVVKDTLKKYFDIDIDQ